MRPHRIKGFGWVDLDRILKISDVRFTEGGSKYAGEAWYGWFQYELELAFRDKPFTVRSKIHDLLAFEAGVIPLTKIPPPEHPEEEFTAQYRRLLSAWSNGEIWEELP